MTMKARKRKDDPKINLATRLLKLARGLERRAPQMHYLDRRAAALAKASAYRHIAGLIRKEGMKLVSCSGVSPNS